MPQEPKKRHSKQRQGKRRKHIKLELAGFALCENCKVPKLPHIVCGNCGWYHGRTMLVITKKEERKKPTAQDEEKK